MRVAGHDIAVCSWSLQPTSMGDLVEKVRQLGLTHVQLALGELIMLDDKRKHLELGHLRSAGLTLTGGMMAFPGEDYATIERIAQTGGYAPDESWPLRKRLTLEGARLAAELGMSAITTHVGFVPPRGDARYAVIRQRVAELAEALAAMNLRLLMETGQESAEELLHFLNDLNSPAVGINFDPANMILYGAGDPIDAVRILGKHIGHVHVKDGAASSQPGKIWGEETPFGTGQVNAGAFLGALQQAGYSGPLAIEREAGNQRIADVKTAIETLQAALKK